jgi:hypothetical protein
MLNQFYVYIYRDADNSVVYVGSGRARRAWSHLGYQGNSPLELLIQKRRTAGIALQPEIIKYFEDRRSAFKYEAELILKHGLKEHGGTLLNKVWGSLLDLRAKPDRRSPRKRRTFGKYADNGLDKHG